MSDVRHDATKSFSLSMSTINKSINPTSASQIESKDVLKELGSAKLNHPLINRMTMTKRATDNGNGHDTKSELYLRVLINPEMLYELSIPFKHPVIKFKFDVPNRFSSNYKLDKYFERVKNSSTYSIIEGSDIAKSVFNLSQTGKVGYLVRRLQPTKYINLMDDYLSGDFKYVAMSNDPELDTNPELIDALHRKELLIVDTNPGSGKSPIDDVIIDYLRGLTPEYNPDRTDPKYNTDDSVEYDKKSNRVVESFLGNSHSRTSKLISSINEYSVIDPDAELSEEVPQAEEEYVRALARSIDEFSEELDRLLKVYSDYSFDYTEYSDFGPETTLDDLQYVNSLEIELYSPSDDPICKVRLVLDEDTLEVSYTLRPVGSVAKSYPTLYYIIRELGVLIREDQELTADLAENFSLEDVEPYNELEYEPLVEDLDEVDSLDFDPVDDDDLLSETSDPMDIDDEGHESDTPLDVRMKERIERRRSENR